MILVTGATGYVGRAAMRRLSAAGHAVIAMARDARKAERTLPSGTQVRIADYDERAGLDEAFVDEASPFYFAPVYRDAERRLAEGGAEWTILRCGLYADFVLAHWLRPALSTGEVSLPLGPARIAPISRDDVAERPQQRSPREIAAAKSTS